MAIKGFKEIVDKKGYKVNSKDRTIFEREIGKAYFGMGVSDMIEFILYDLSDNQLPQGEEESLVRYIPLDNQNIRKYFIITNNKQNKKLNGADEYIIDVEKLVTEAGYSNGIFKTQVNLINRRVGSEKIEKDKLWIHEISPSRTEIRVLPLETKDEEVYEDLQNRLDIVLNEKHFRDDTIYFVKSMVEAIKVEEVLKSFLLLNGNVTLGENYVKLIKKEFKINDWDLFINNIKEKLVEGAQYFIENRNWDISSLNYGKPLSTEINLELSIDKIVETLNSILIKIIDKFLPKQSIQDENILTIDEQKTLDETTKILKTLTANSKYDTDSLSNRQPIVRGCTDKSALNYNPLAVEDDGSCIYLPIPKEETPAPNPKKKLPPPPPIDEPKIKEYPTITKMWYGWAPTSIVNFQDKYGNTNQTKIYENAGQSLTYVDGSLTFDGDIRETTKQETYIPKQEITTPEIVINTGGGSGGSGGSGGFIQRDFGTGFGRETVVDGSLIDRQNIQ
jgi:hypothetical protein